MHNWLWDNDLEGFRCAAQILVTEKSFVRDKCEARISLCNCENEGARRRCTEENDHVPLVKDAENMRSGAAEI